MRVSSFSYIGITPCCSTIIINIFHAFLRAMFNHARMASMDTWSCNYFSNTSFQSDLRTSNGLKWVFFFFSIFSFVFIDSISIPFVFVVCKCELLTVDYFTGRYNESNRWSKDLSFSLKILRLSSQAMNNFSSGQIMNLLANDANKIEFAHYFFNHLWVSIRDMLLMEWIYDLIIAGCTSTDYSGYYSLLEFRQIYYICRYWLHALSVVSTAVI